MTLTFISSQPGGPTQVKAAGGITSADFSAGGKEPLEVLLDLGGVSYIDSSAIGWLINVQRALRDSGGRLVVHSAQRNVRKILDVLKVGRVVPLADSESDARALVSAGAA